MNAKVKKLLFRVGAVVIVLAIAAVMMVIGRGHTIYFDNKPLTYNGTEYPAYYKVEISVKSEDKPINLTAKSRDSRGSTTWIGQSFHMDLVVTESEGDSPKELSMDLDLPYGMDNPILNLPALLADLPEDAWLDEFIPTPSTEDDTDDVDLGDAFGGGIGTENVEGEELPDTGSDFLG